VLGIGIDWAEEFHVVALGDPDRGVFEIVRVDHRPSAVDGFVARVTALEPDPGQVRVVLETRHGLLVERLVEAGYVVVPVNPTVIARRRGPAGKKDDVEDARLACLVALDRHTHLRPLVPHGEPSAELRAIARDDERVARDERRLTNRLRADLAAVFPAALALDLGATTVLHLLVRWPTAAELAAATSQDIEALARAARHPQPARFVDRVRTALAAESFVAPAHLARAKRSTIAFNAAQLLAMADQRRAWERRMGELLVGSDQPGLSVPDGEIYLSFPGLGSRLAARVAGEIGDHIEQFESPNALQCYAGQAPVTRRSGKSEFVVAKRLACNHSLRDAVHQWAFCSLRSSSWARDFYDEQRGRSKGHHAALRALGNRWLEVLWHCVIRHLTYDETVHTANRHRHQPQAA
jgi:transposase